MEWQAEQDLLCPGCDSPRDETMADDRLVALGVVPDYVPEMHRCRKCEATDAARNAARESPGDVGSGAYFVAREVWGVRDAVPAT